MSWRCTEPAAALTLTRRDCLGLAIAALGGATRATDARAADAAGNDDAALRAALDALYARRGKADPTGQLASLSGFEAARLSSSAAVDLDTVRAGLAIDARIASLGDRHDAGAAAALALFALQLERCLGEAIAPADAHRMFDREVRRLGARADRLLRGLGHRRGSVGARFVALAGEPRWLYSDDNAGRDRVVVDMTRWLDAARARMAADFTDVPAHCFNVRVARLTPEEEAAGKQGYRTLPTPTTGGAYVVDLREIRRRPSWTLQAVVHHELLPGHMVQMPMEVAAGAHPLRLDYTRAFMEGWATYAEQLAGDEGAFKGDALAELGQIHWLLFRAVRGLIDTGINHLGWSRAQALQTLHEAQGLPAYFASFDADIDRVTKEPAVRAAEALVWLRLRAIRDQAAPRVSRREFHRIVLQDGRRRMDAIEHAVRG